MLKKILITTITFIFLLCLTLNSVQANTSAEPTLYASTTTNVSPGKIIKGNSDAVYYLGLDNKRYVFPNFKTYRTWYVNFTTVVQVPDDFLWSKPLGGNVTYKPGIRLVKIVSDPKVYYVDKNGTLRHVATETVAKSLFGNDWQMLIDDIPVAFFINYQVGEPINEPALPTIEPNYSISQDKQISTQPDQSFTKQIDLEAAVSGNTVKLNWYVNFNSEKGYKVVYSTSPNPVYPGNDYHYITDYLKVTDTWTLNPGTYHFRVCEYTGSGCATYSNDVQVTVAGSTSNFTKQINLQAFFSGNNVDLSWTINFTSLQGYKVVISTSPNPVYPGNDYHYITDYLDVNDTWTNLSPGTYHFRVCEYLGGSCGVYSNDVAVNIQ